MVNSNFYYFRVWRGGNGKIVGIDLTIDEYLRDLRNRSILHSFPGRRGTVCIVSEHPEISRQEKLNFAIAFMEGKLLNVNVDLNELVTTTTEVPPPPEY